MALENVTTKTSFLDKKLDMLESSWLALPSFDEFMTWDEDRQVDYLEEFRADRRYYHELIHDEAARLLSPAQLERLRCIEQLMVERRPLLRQLETPVEDE